MTRNISVLLLVCTVSLAGCRTAQSSRDVATTGQFSSNAAGSACFVRLFRDDGSYYLTRQSQKADSTVGLLQVWGNEPEGRYLWQFSSQGFVVQEGNAKLVRWLPDGLSGEDYCRLVMASFQTVSAIQTAAVPVRMLGNWAISMGSDERVTWYRSTDAQQTADIVTLSTSAGMMFVARGYDYHTGKTGLVPSRLEVFRADSAGTNERLVMRLDYVE